jgi:hypothetical protein
MDVSDRVGSLRKQTKEKKKNKQNCKGKDKALWQGRFGCQSILQVYIEPSDRLRGFRGDRKTN